MKKLFLKLSLVILLFLITNYQGKAQSFFYSNNIIRHNFDSVDFKIKTIALQIYNLLNGKDSILNLEVSSIPITKFSDDLQRQVFQNFTQADLLKINTKEISEFLKANRPDAFSLELNLSSQKVIIDLLEVELLGSDFKVTNEQNQEIKDIKLGLYYQGTIRGQAGFATLNVFDDEINGIFHDEAGNQLLELGKVEKEENTYIIYDQKKAKNLIKEGCGLSSSPTFTKELENIYQNANKPYHQTRSINCFSNFWDVAYDLYVNKGSNAQNVVNYMTSIFNNFNLVYSNEALGTTLNQLYIWTTQDPWVNASITDNDRLNNYSGGRTNFGSNLAAIFSTYGAGIAWVNSICSSNQLYKHAYCGNMGFFFNNFPTYSWAVNTTCHEVGHNCGSSHTHACVWNGNNTAIDGCGPAAGYPPVPQPCATAPLPPSGGGTIMSYCHANVGINLANGFGLQPGNVIRSTSSCYANQQCNSSGGVSSFCTAPSNLQTSNTTIASTILSWTASANATYYYVELSRNGGVYSLAANNITNNSVLLNNLIPSSNYTARVFVKCANGALYSSTKFFSTPAQVCNTTSDVPTNGMLLGASAINFNLDYNGFIDSNTDIDFYKYTKQTNKPVNISLNSYGKPYTIQLYKGNGILLANATTNGSIKNIIYGGVPGTYYIKVYSNVLNNFTTQLCYNLKASYNAYKTDIIPSENSLSVHPNPTVNQASIKVLWSDAETNAKLFVKDITGKTLLTEDIILLFGENETKINVENFAQGMYIIQLLSDNNTQLNTKLLKN
jgi:hypothetical protein